MSNKQEELFITDDAHPEKQTRVQVDYHQNGLSIKFPDLAAIDGKTPEVYLDFFGGSINVLIHNNTTDKTGFSPIITKARETIKSP